LVSDLHRFSNFTFLASTYSAPEKLAISRSWVVKIEEGKKKPTDFYIQVHPVLEYPQHFLWARNEKRKILRARAGAGAKTKNSCGRARARGPNLKNLAGARSARSAGFFQHWVHPMSVFLMILVCL
jgi:hypothetical protein